MFAGTNDNKENEFAMGVQIRPRAEYRNGVLFPREIGQTPAGFINNRSRLMIDFKRDRLSIGLAAQHVGVWGQDPQIDKNGRVMFNEAWANLELGYGLFMKFGRQSLVYDDERILGSLDWNVSGRFHDALKMGYEDNLNKLHLILSFNQNDEHRIDNTYYASGAQPYKSMQTLWYQHLFSSRFKTSLLFMNLGLQEENVDKTWFMQTMGANLNYAYDGLQVNGTFYYQSGKTKAGQSISAFMWSVNGGYQFTPEWRVNAGVDFLSGADSGSGKHKAFDPLYGTHHKFYGAMDYFYASAFVDGYNPGLCDTQLGVSYKASPTVNVSLNYHYFTTAANVYDTATLEKQDKGLGSEIDLQVDWNIMKDVRLSAGYSTMFGTNTMKVVKGGNPSHWQDWGWVSINVNPKVFITKW
ncbi:MAG: alginate export family protein [Tannerellaceae bacterium]|nr:alginate export family protein [Tannerellaceae bacterium]